MSNEKVKKAQTTIAPKPWYASIKKEWLLVAVTMVVTFIIFSPVLKGDFVQWDDDENITINSNIKELNTASIKNIFTSSVTSGYTPLTSLSFAIEYKFFGMKPGVFHFNNLLLHLLCTLLVFVLMKKLGFNLFIVMVVTILFGVHPMRVESVAWITERKDVLYSFFFLLSLISYLSFYKNKRTIFYVLSLLAFILALLSKIQAVSLPLILLIFDYFFEKKFRFRQVLNKIPFFVLSLATGLAGMSILLHEGTMDTGTVLPFIQRIFIGSYSLCVYLVKSLVPYQFSAIYPYPETLSIIYYGSVIVLILLAFLVYKAGKYRGDLIFGLLFFLFNVMFVLQIVGAGTAFLADRFTYIPYIGLFFLIGWALNFLYISKWKNYVILFGLIYLAILGITTWDRTQVWENTETLFSDVVKKYPKVSMAYNNLGVYYRDHNQYDKAISSYEKSIAINPGGYVTYNNLGELYFDRGEVDKALEDMNIAIKLKPDYIKALNNRGAALGSKNEFDLALKDLDKAIALDPGNLSAYSNRILVYFSNGKYEKALQDVNFYLQNQPDHADMLNMRGLCHSQLNKNQEALADFTKSIQLNPRAGAYYKNRSSLFYKMGDNKNALSDILKARDLGTKVNPAYLEILQKK
jgi:protein O-mannosyl-transferase